MAPSGEDVPLLGVPVLSDGAANLLERVGTTELACAPSRALMVSSRFTSCGPSMTIGTPNGPSKVRAGYRGWSRDDWCRVPTNSVERRRREETSEDTELRCKPFRLRPLSPDVPTPPITYPLTFFRVRFLRGSPPNCFSPFAFSIIESFVRCCSFRARISFDGTALFEPPSRISRSTSQETAAPSGSA